MVPEQHVHALPDRKRELFAVLRSLRDRPAVDNDGPVTLRSGVGDPVVLIHPSDGELGCYGPVTQHWPQGPPLVGLRADALMRGSTVPEVEALAAHYVGRLSRAGLRPAVVGGWSFGGVVAYEMARIILASGQPVGTALIDPVPRSTEHLEWGDDEPTLLKYFMGFTARGGPRPIDVAEVDPAVWHRPRREAMAGVLDELRRLGVQIRISIDELLTRYTVYLNTIASLRAYRPRPGGPPARMLWATRSSEDLPGMWWELGRVPMIVTAVPDTHEDLMRPPRIVETTRFLYEALDQGSPVRGTPG